MARISSSLATAVALLALVASTAACGAMSRSMPYPSVAQAAGASYDAEPEEADESGGYGGEEQSRYAQVDPAPPMDAQAPGQPQAQGQQTPPVATDAVQGPLLIYTATLGLAVHHVTENQDRVEAIARELGGFLASRDDSTIVIRVPARGFERALAQIQELGDVLTRQVQVQDVSEEFHDVQLRIRTLEAMRARVEQLLRDARDVQAALAIEQHLERITLQLEQLRGRIRFLSDRIAFSTVTVRFTPRTEARDPHVQLPFGWLRGLGLDTLLAL